MKNRFAVIFFGMLLWLPFIFSCPAGADEEIPIVITAESLEVELNRNKAVFLGGVKAVQGEGVLKADKIEILFDKNEGNINKLTAKGNVRINEGNSTGICEEAIYEFSPKRKIILKGNPLLKRDKQKFSGEIIVFYIDEDRVVIKEKVRGVVFPQKDGQGIWNN